MADKRNINSAIALTQTKKTHKYHVFAYKINTEVDNKGDNPLYGAVIILGSFDAENEEKARDLAVSYGKDMIDASGYNMILWTKSHKWFELRKRPTFFDEGVYYVDDKSGLTHANEFINKEELEKLKAVKKQEKNLKEERRLNRCRSNIDHVEHYIGCVEEMVKYSRAITEYEELLEKSKEEYTVALEKLKCHYDIHPSHEEDGLNLLKIRMGGDFGPLMSEYSKARNKIVPNDGKVYRKKGRSLNGDFSEELSKSLEKSTGERDEKKSEDGVKERSEGDKSDSEDWRKDRIIKNKLYV